VTLLELANNGSFLKRFVLWLLNNLTSFAFGPLVELY